MGRRLIVTNAHPAAGALGVTHWSARLLAEQLGVSFAAVSRNWRKWDLQPWKE